ncbi:toxin-antitoxin system HicB family antitoxin [Methylophilus sp. 13]|uniref:toxin-antitoxin system HicB family antitoxin n=1 Tax=Methylophilus sp. 13 TaxID=2781018 RepID=UPI00188E6AE6|nr:toxin-antitoxin system HicB family antitoxin [Methylophilus sp. 13]MBF5038436.1 toxin-antitoxin system HicB family antitoxin [Methylophilus sp. 13]
MSKASTYPLRLPQSLKDAVDAASKRDGTSINQFVAMAVAEKISALETAEFFSVRQQQADYEKFDAIMNRSGGQAPIKGDVIGEE